MVCIIRHSMRQTTIRPVVSSLKLRRDRKHACVLAPQRCEQLRMLGFNLPLLRQQTLQDRARVLPPPALPVNIDLLAHHALEPLCVKIPLIAPRSRH